MAAQIGQFALAFAWVVTAYSIIASFLGIRLKNDNLIASGRNAALGAFLDNDGHRVPRLSVCHQRFFLRLHRRALEPRSADVFQDRFDLGWSGRLAALLGLAADAVYGLVMIQNWRKHSSTMPYVMAVLMTTSLFFTAMHLFVVNPFTLDRLQFPRHRPICSCRATASAESPAAGRLMVIHPPMLYLGFVGFAVPFAFAMAA